MTQRPYVTLLLIDPQNDFVRADGALSVPGAEAGAAQLSLLIERAADRIDAVSLSLDSHQRLDISHPLWFVDERGRHPDPFTVITAADVERGAWRARDEVAEYTLSYLQTLEARQRYPHLIWPEHCLIGSEGHAVYPEVQEALHTWANRPARVDYIHKGQNPRTEHFSAVEAEVPDPDDPSTQVNEPLMKRLMESDQVWVAGWARSHCVGNTLYDLFRIGGEALARKTILVSDAMSDVAGFEAQGEAVTRDALKLGAQVKDVASLSAQ